MEMNEDGFLEELLALRRVQAWETNPTAISAEINGFFSATTWGFDGLDSVPPPPQPPPSVTTGPILPNSTSYESFSSSCSFPADFYVNATSSAALISPDSAFPVALVEGDCGGMGHLSGTCKPEPALSGEIPATPSTFNMGMCMENNANSSNGGGSSGSSIKSKVKKIGGQPSKNLMAERRRRKRLNDRLSMLRSVVPKISKMDRTSILGDTIDYMKELVERIKRLQEEIDVGGSNQLNVMSIFKDEKPNDVLVRNSPKFDVERRNLDTRVEICCAGKPGLLLSTVTTLEALGLEVQQCVISCFNDFSLQASCSEEMEQRTLISSEEIKQALFRNAGYGGRCL